MEPGDEKDSRGLNRREAKEKAHHLACEDTRPSLISQAIRDGKLSRKNAAEIHEEQMVEQLNSVSFEEERLPQSSGIAKVSIRTNKADKDRNGGGKVDLDADFSAGVVSSIAKKSNMKAMSRDSPRHLAIAPWMAAYRAARLHRRKQQNSPTEQTRDHFPLSCEHHRQWLLLLQANFMESSSRDWIQCKEPIRRVNIPKQTLAEESTCAKCGAANAVFTALNIAGYCTRCGNGLEFKRTKAKFSNVSDFVACLQPRMALLGKFGKSDGQFGLDYDKYDSTSKALVELAHISEMMLVHEHSSVGRSSSLSSLTKKEKNVVNELGQRVKEVFSEHISKPLPMDWRNASDLDAALFDWKEKTMFLSVHTVK